MLQEKGFLIVLTLSVLVKEELCPRKMFSNQLNSSFINAMGTLQLFILVKKVLTEIVMNQWQ